MPVYLKIAIISSLMFIFIIPSSAEFYQYVDNKGITHFTDKISTIPATYQQQVNKDHKRISLPEELPYPEFADNDLTEKKAAQKKSLASDKIPSKTPKIRELQMEKSRLLEQKKAIEQKFDMLMAEKQQIERRKKDVNDKENILLYNQNVKTINKHIQLFREEENRFKQALDRYNDSIISLTGE